MANMERVKELNEEALKLDSMLKELRQKISDEIAPDFISGNIESLQQIVNLINADCLSYYRSRIYTKMSGQHR